MIHRITEQVIQKIEEQQKGKEGTTIYMVGEQLKDICKEGPQIAEIVLQDLDVKEMSIIECEKKIKAYADELHKKIKGRCVGVSPQAAEKIIREFYGINKTVDVSKPDGKVVSLMDLM